MVSWLYSSPLIPIRSVPSSKSVTTSAPLIEAPPSFALIVKTSIPAPPV